MFYDKVFAAAYRAYKKHEGKAFHFSAVIYVSTCQVSLLLLLMSIIKRVFNVDLFSWAPNQYYFLALAMVILVINRIYYSEVRAINILDVYGKMPKTKRIIWGIVAVLAFLLPAVSGIFLIVNY